ncbi:MAG: prephenate dehydrogenase/arogenate dehydrogenase family protein [Coriobacteriales bacterium]|nr:prephenate dehydrogenase/arogenate dehydrogenase family protein [Coriobacteriales bacterium]
MRQPTYVPGKHPSIPADSTFVPGRIGILGLGLMGGSFAKALHAGGAEVLAWNRTQATVELAKIECVDGDLDDTTIPTCELIVLAGYPQVSIEWLRRCAPLISAGAIVIDLVGVKRSICEACFAIADEYDWTFVGCHPMAGTHNSGFAYTRADMFVGAPMVVVPPQIDDFVRLDVLERLTFLLEPCGFGTFTLTSAEHHDEVIAFTSQLAHVVSNAYVKSPSARVHKGFSAGSYKDLTRVAQLNAQMWSELFLENGDYLSRELGILIDNLQQYRDAIDAHDAERLKSLLADGDRRKREIDAHE